MYGIVDVVIAGTAYVAKSATRSRCEMINRSLNTTLRDKEPAIRNGSEIWPDSRILHRIESWNNAFSILASCVLIFHSS